MKHRVLAVLLVWAAVQALPAAADFAPVTEAERALTAVPGEPNAPAVVLFRKGEILFAGYGGERISRLRIEARVKILTEEGKSSGELVVHHSAEMRLLSFEGRTVLPDGRAIAVPADAKFVRKQSRSHKRFVSAVAFPAVQVGAILDYRFEIVFDSLFYLEPWYFSDEVPVLYSEIVHKIPVELQAQTWSRVTSEPVLQQTTKTTSRGTELKTWAQNFPSVPNEPFGLPFSDLATQVTLLPTAYTGNVAIVRLYDNWASTCKLLEKSYAKARRKAGGLAGKAKEVAGTGLRRALSPRR